MNLTINDLFALSPLLILLGGALWILLIESFVPNFSKKVAFLSALITILLAMGAAIVSPASGSQLLVPWLRFDSLSHFFTLFFLLIGVSAVLLSATFFDQLSTSQGEYYFLLLSSIFGLILMGASADFLTLVIGLETLSIALYILCGYIKGWISSQESAMKYFFMGSIAAAFLLYGIALIYGAVGTTQFAPLLAKYQAITDFHYKILFLWGLVFVTFGFAFKATIVPFHFWAPDVYQGAPTPVTAFMSVGTKVGAFAALALLFLVFIPNFDPFWNIAIEWLSYATMIYGNFLALRQTELRRFFAYSGISHSGLMLSLFAASGPDSLNALLFYLVVYSLATLGAFSVLAYLPQRGEGIFFKDLQGLFYRSPLLTFLFALSLLTLAGIPPTVGFFAKFFLFKSVFQAGYIGLVIVGLLTAILSAYYYLRIVNISFSKSVHEPEKIVLSWPAVSLGILAITALIWLSIYPEPLFANLLMLRTR